MLSRAREIPILVAGVLAGAVVIATELTSDHQDARIVWAVFGPAVGWSFIGTGLYAWRRRPESRTGALMVLLGFAWFLFTLQASDAPLIYTVASAVGGLWGGIFLHLGVSFPSGRLTSVRDRGLVIAGYLIIPFAFLPALLVASPGDLRCDDCPDNLLLIERHETAARVLFGLGALLYVGLFVLVLIRSVRHWRAARPLERLQLTPVYVCALLTFLLVTVAQAGAGDIAWWPAFVSTALMPFAFLGGLLRSHVSRLDAELRARLEELRASRARLVEAGDAERRRLERDLHDGAQSRLVALALLLRGARARAEAGSELAAMLDRATAELRAGLDELRELARGIHPAALTELGLVAALRTLTRRAPITAGLTYDSEARCSPPAEAAAYFLVAEALTNVVRYAEATRADVHVGLDERTLTVSIKDDGRGGADPRTGSGLRGMQDRLAALDGTLTIDSPPGAGTLVTGVIPCGS